MKALTERLDQAPKAVVAAILLSLSFALMGVWVRMMAGSLDSFQQTYLRILLAGLIALVIFRKQLSKGFFRSLSKKEWGIYGVRAVMAYTVGVAAFTIAIQHADLGVVSFICTMPVLGLLALLLFREKLPLVSVPFILLSAVGVFFLTGTDIHDFHLGIGEVASLVALLGFNIGFLMSRLHRKERNNFENTTVLLLIGWIPVCGISIALHEPLLPQQLSLTAVVGLILSAIFNIVGLYATNYIFTNLKAYVAGNILLLESVWAVIIGAIWYGEPVTTAIAIGGLLIIGSALAINRMEAKNNEAPVAELDAPDT